MTTRNYLHSTLYTTCTEHNSYTRLRQKLPNMSKPTHRTLKAPKSFQPRDDLNVRHCNAPTRMSFGSHHLDAVRRRTMTDFRRATNLDHSSHNDVTLWRHTLLTLLSSHSTSFPVTALRLTTLWYYYNIWANETETNAKLGNTPCPWCDQIGTTLQIDSLLHYFLLTKELKFLAVYPSTSKARLTKNLN